MSSTRMGTVSLGIVEDLLGTAAAFFTYRAIDGFSKEHSSLADAIRS